MPDRAVRFFGAITLLAGVQQVSKPVWDTICAVQQGHPPVCTAAASLDLAGALLLLVALVGVYAVQAEASGRPGLFGFTAAMVGTGLFAGVKWMRLFMQPWLLERHPEITAAPVPSLFRAGLDVSFGLSGIGLILFALATFRAGVLPRAAAVLIGLSPIVDHLLPPALANGMVAGPVIGIGLVWLGAAMLRRERGAAAGARAFPAAARA